MSREWARSHVSRILVWARIYGLEEGIYPGKVLLPWRILSGCCFLL